MKIWLDDIRPAPEGWIWVKNAHEFAAVNADVTQIEAISFDNDLGDGEREGWEIAKDLLAFYIVHDDLKHVPILTCHSANVAARPRIEGYFRDIRRLVKGR